MTALIEELPYAWALKYSENKESNEIAKRCSYCCQPAYQKCSCKVAVYCDKTCMQNDRQWHQAECQALTHAAAQKYELLACGTSSQTRLMGRIISRILIDQGEQDVYKNGWAGIEPRQLCDLTSSIDDEQEFQELEADFHRFYQHVPQISTAITTSDLRQLYSKVDFNCFKIGIYSLSRGAKSVGVALYLNNSRFQHSCDPQLIYWHEGNKIILRNVGENSVKLENRSIKYSESAIGIFGLTTAAERQKKLKKEFGIECKCEMCTDKIREEILALSVKQDCPKCQGIMVIRNDKKGVSQIQCIHCLYLLEDNDDEKIKASQILNAIQDIHQICQEYNQEENNNQECIEKNGYGNAEQVKKESYIEMQHFRQLLHYTEQILHPVTNIHVLRLREILFDYYSTQARDKQVKQRKRIHYARRSARHRWDILQTYQVFLPESSLWKAMHCCQLYKLNKLYFDHQQRNLAHSNNNARSAGELLPVMLECLRKAEKVWQMQCPANHRCLKQLSKEIQDIEALLIMN